MTVFSFLDEVAEVKKNEEVTAFFLLRGDEEFLNDHFEGFPVMPGVLQLEALKQAAVRLLSESHARPAWAYRLVEARDVRFGQFVRPGSRLKINVRLVRQHGSRLSCTGRMDLIQNGAPAGRSLSADLEFESVRI
jgi:3-hydroxyacyl-[acyl-carrier-protein] dehydratase